MGGKPKTVKPPPPPSPQAIPDVAPEVEDIETKKARKRGGYQRTILTGQLVPTTGKRTTLG